MPAPGDLHALPHLGPVLVVLPAALALVRRMLRRDRRLPAGGVVIVIPDRAMSTMRRVVLTKTAEDDGMPVGWTFEWTYTTATREQAVVRAFRALKVEFSGERAECWEAS